MNYRGLSKISKEPWCLFRGLGAILVIIAVFFRLVIWLLVVFTWFFKWTVTWRMRDKQKRITQKVFRRGERAVGVFAWHGIINEVKHDLHLSVRGVSNPGFVDVDFMTKVISVFLNLLVIREDCAKQQEENIIIVLEDEEEVFWRGIRSAKIQSKIRGG